MSIREQALAFAIEAHKGQLRKDNDEDYITHPIAVAVNAERIAREYGVNKSEYLDKIYATALLHDTMEDCGIEREVIKDSFTLCISDCVVALTRVAGETYFDYIIHMITTWIHDPIPLLVKLADLEHNMNDLSEGSLKDKYRFAHFCIKSTLDVRYSRTQI